MADLSRPLRTQDQRRTDDHTWRHTAHTRPGYATYPQTPPGDPSWWRHDPGPRWVALPPQAPGRGWRVHYVPPDPGGWGDVHQVVRVLPPRHGAAGAHQRRRRAAAAHPGQRLPAVCRRAARRAPPPLVAPIHPEEPVTQPPDPFLAYLREAAAKLDAALPDDHAAPSDDAAIEVVKFGHQVLMSDELLMDAGVIPDTRPPVRIPWHRRLRWRISEWRERFGRKVGGWIAGVDLTDRED